MPKRAWERFLESTRRKNIARISEFYKAHYLPRTVLVPSGRFGLYTVVKEMLRPGDHVLVSPITCHTVVEALLAGQVNPVFVGIELETGNIDIKRLSPSLLASAKGIITTNLYGNADQVTEIRALTKAHGLLWIEDCAHVLETTVDGQRVGSFGDVSIFSFKKYFRERGGIITMRDADAMRQVENRVLKDSRMFDSRQDRLRYTQHQISRFGGQFAARVLAAGYRRFRGSFDGSKAVGTPEADESIDNDRSSPALDRGADCEFPSTAALLRVADQISRHGQLVADALRRTEELVRHSPLPIRRNRNCDRVCYLVAPVLFLRRDEVVARMKSRGVPTYFMYNPPMTQRFARVLRAQDLDEESVTEWSQQILPVPLPHGREYVEEICGVIGSVPVET